jgi:hypothetical protein
LIVAIPSVLVFNLLSSRIASYEASLLKSGSELIDRLETSVASHAPSQQPAMQAPQAPSQPAPRMAPPARVR